MLMTENEQQEMLQMIEEAKRLNEQKTDLMQDIIATCAKMNEQNELLLRENALLKKQNELLERQLKIAEKHIMREHEPQS